MSANDSIHAALRAAQSPRVWKLAGALALACSGWATWAAERSSSAAPPAPAECNTAAELATEHCRLLELERGQLELERDTLACREQSALALQSIVGVIVQGGARGNATQREAAAAAAQRRFKRALLQGSTFEQAVKEALGGAD